MSDSNPLDRRVFEDGNACLPIVVMVLCAVAFVVGAVVGFVAKGWWV